MSKIYLIPGMGADSRIYKHVELPESDEVIRVDWIEPGEKDTLADYAQKLVNHYHIQPGSIIIGNSLGGMLAIEIAKSIYTKKTVLISSIRSINEAPAYFSFFWALPVYRLIPGKWMTSMSFVLKFAFGNMAKENKALFMDMLKNTSPDFLKWSMGAVLAWDNRIVPPGVFQLIGDKDRVFTYRKQKSAKVIKGGTHIMIFDKAREVNDFLRKVLAE
jgi:pimeloyl-ACP methyl ester carboxylesterase